MIESRKSSGIMPPASALCRAYASIRATLPGFLPEPSRFPPRMSNLFDLSIINQFLAFGDRFKT
jgi:hypothetical protein